MRYMQNILSYTSLIIRNDQNNKKTYGPKSSQAQVNQHLHISKRQNFKEVSND